MSKISRNQVICIQIYRRAAQLNDHDYRSLLFKQTGKNSSKVLTQPDFDIIMPIMETLVCEAWGEGRIDTLPKQIQSNSLTYWRKRQKKWGNGINSREFRKIMDLFYIYKGQSDCSDDYLLGIASRACNRSINDLDTLNHDEVTWVMYALRCKIEHLNRERPQAS